MPAEPSDNAWTAGCRALQSWWRAEVLGFDPGPRTANPASRLVDSMLPLDAPRDANFYPGVAAEVERRLSQQGWGGITATDRLYRNLLSSQPMTFNVFAPLKRHPDALLAWVRTLDVDAVEVLDVRIEWAPPRDRHFGGGSAFDAAVLYRRPYDDTVGLIGVECKYAEDLSRQTLPKPDQLDKYASVTRTGGRWRSGATDRLTEKRLVQLWLNTLLAQSCVDKQETVDIDGSTYRIGEATVVMMAAAADRKALDATADVRCELVAPDRWLAWSPYEAVVDATSGFGALTDWAEWIISRYLDFAPVAGLLDDHDPRCRPDPLDDARAFARARLTAEIDRVEAIAARVLGGGGVLVQIVDGDQTGFSAVGPLTLAAHLAEIGEALRRTHEIAAATFDKLHP